MFYDMPDHPAVVGLTRQIGRKIHHGIPYHAGQVLPLGVEQILNRDSSDYPAGETIPYPGKIFPARQRQAINILEDQGVKVVTQIPELDVRKILAGHDTESPIIHGKIPGIDQLAQYEMGIDIILVPKGQPSPA